MRRRDIVAGAGDRHGRGRSRRADRGSADGGVRAAADRPGRAPGRRGVVRGDVPEVPRRPGLVRGGRGTHGRGRDRGGPVPAQSPGRAGPARRRDGGTGTVDGARRRGAGPPGGTVRRTAGRCAERGARHAGRAVSERGVRRAAGPHHLGPDQRRAARAAGFAAAGRHLRRHDPGPRPVHRDDPWRRERARLARGRVRRRDGVRVAGRRHDSARHVVVADHRYHARPRDRRPGAGRARAHAVLEGRRARAAAGTGPGTGKVRPGNVHIGHGQGARAGGDRRTGRAGLRQPAGVPGGTEVGDPARPQRPDDPPRTLPGRAGRLADRRPLAVRRPGQRALGLGDRGPAPGKPRGRRPGRPLRRRHRATSPGRTGRRRHRGHHRP